MTDKEQQAGGQQAAPAGPRPPIESYPLEFTGRGAEYFRVWIVNVLLTIVTVALFTPVARWRTAKYFYSHTLVADSPLEFVGRLSRMVIAFFMLVLLYIAFNLAAETGQVVATGLFVLAGFVLAPFLWGSAMRFRLSATRWRGLRPRLAASWGRIYLEAWPVYLMIVVWAAFGIGVAMIPETQRANGKSLPDIARHWPLFVMLLLGVIAATALAYMRLEYNFKRLLVTGARIGGHAGVWKIAFGSFVKIWFQMAGLVIAAAIVGGVVIAIIAFAAGAGAKGRGPSAFFALIPLLILMLMFVLSAPARAWREARVFQLMWDNIGLSGVARFKCNLSAGSFVWLRIKNVLLTLVTIGFWRPFAKVSEARMKAESVTLHVRGGLDNWVGQLEREEQHAFGDAIADAVGLDLGG